ncbi:methyl-accepting chemotaxis protein [Inconstantimicrobium mannanitabidum]|uniref:Methyl-accepting chemotaxis protein n=1 Tax=Inconstantimicrobium mannanitabidum TaxID=1604901 RepID=A0ACB5R9D3_9CLOT|nr:methyl-accepting chemotaxis protein [Clostridium sp. TW13]GKX65790.1 methyl-accepting chemotaxis protein [Clostridium sp. TW13]
MKVIGNKKFFGIKATKILRLPTMKISNYKRLPIKKKLLLAFMLIAVLTVICGGLGLVFLQKTNSDYKYALNNYGFSQGTIGKLGMEVEDSKSIIRDVIMLKDTNEATKATDELDNCISRIQKSISELEKSEIAKDNKQLFNKISYDIAQYQVVKIEVINLSMAKKSDEALKSLREKATPMMNQITDDISNLMKASINTGNKVVDKLKMMQIIASVIIVLAIAIACIFTVRLAMYLSKIIGNPIKEIAKVAEKISKGELDVSIDISSEDEIGELANSFSIMITSLRSYIYEISDILESISKGNLDIATKVEYKGDFIELEDSINTILDSLNEVFNEFNEASKQVNTGSEQVAGTSIVLSEGATEQASIIEELSASMQEVSEKIDRNAKNAANTNEITHKLVSNIEQSTNQMKEVVNAIDDIERASKDISSIIVTIDDIAEETNLLALNASIEAARAGEAGKGFAVVAEEVRKLANQSAEAAKQTAKLINISMQAVNQGRLLADNTAINLFQVADNVNETTGLVNDITVASEEQAQAIKQINDGIIQISDVVQSNSAIAEESAAASEELTAQVEALNTMIRKFTIRN